MTKDEVQSQLLLQQLECSRCRNVLSSIRALCVLPVVKTLGFFTVQFESIQEQLDDALEPHPSERD